MKSCDLIDKCGFFIKYSKNSEVIKQGWIAMFCHDLEKAKNCQRKKIRDQTGQPPADNMTPLGKIL